VSGDACGVSLGAPLGRYMIAVGSIPSS
jgi:hypothetical protein